MPTGRDTVWVTDGPMSSGWSGWSGASGASGSPGHSEGHGPEAPPDEGPGWAAPPKPPGGTYAPPPAPYPTDGSTALRGSRRRKASGVGTFAALAVVGVRLLMLAGGDSRSEPWKSNRDEGPPVAGTSLTSEQVCALLTPASLEGIYGVAFRAGRPVDDPGSSPPATGETSAGSSGPLDELGACRWKTKPAEDDLTVSMVSVPPIGGDANRTYELLRPESPVQAFDSSSGVGDEAFFLVRPFNDAAGYRDTMTVRSGGVVLTISVTAPTKPEGGLDLVADVARAAVANLPPPR